MQPVAPENATQTAPQPTQQPQSVETVSTPHVIKIKVRLASEQPSKGQPTKYDPKYCDQLIEYFNINPSHEVIVEDRFGNTVKERVVIVANDLPTLERFAANLEVTTVTLWNWANTHEDFFNAVQRAKDLQKHILVMNGLNKGYDSKFAMFLAKNVTDLKDKTITEEIGERKVIVEHRDYVSEPQRAFIDAEPN